MTNIRMGIVAVRNLLHTKSSASIASIQLQLLWQPSWNQKWSGNSFHNSFKKNARVIAAATATTTATMVTFFLVSSSLTASERNEKACNKGKEKYLHDNIKNVGGVLSVVPQSCCLTQPLSSWTSETECNSYMDLFSANLTKCEHKPEPPKPSQTEENNKPPPSTIALVSTAPSPPSTIRRILHTLRISELPMPRLLTPADKIFEYPSLIRGLKQRKRDEELLRGEIAKEAIEARQSGDATKINQVFEKMSKVAYGEGVTVQMREDFLVKYGCTAYTDEILTYLVEDLASQRGIVEAGAGNGQWARALSDKYDEYIQKQGGKEVDQRKRFDFILPYDDKTSLPLSPHIYHKHTKPAAQYFHPNVRTSDSNNSMLRKWENRGRVLLLVYPPPGPMALDTIKTYVGVSPKHNNIIVYVGEGKGGSNGNEELFDYWLNSGEWVVMNIMDVEPSPGGKGYERMFVLKRVIGEGK